MKSRWMVTLFSIHLEERIGWHWMETDKQSVFIQSPCRGERGSENSVSAQWAEADLLSAYLAGVSRLIPRWTKRSALGGSPVWKGPSHELSDQFRQPVFHSYLIRPFSLPCGVVDVGEHTSDPARKKQMDGGPVFHPVDQMEMDRWSISIWLPHRGEQDSISVCSAQQTCHPPAQWGSL